MAIQLDHVIVPSRQRLASAKLLAELLGVPWEERDITGSERDLRDYSDMIPVTLINGVQHDFWHVSEQRLRAALALLARGSDPPEPPGAPPASPFPLHSPERQAARPHRAAVRP